MQDFETLSRDELLALVRKLWEQVAQTPELLARIAALEAEILRLRKDPPSGVARAVPAFVKANAAPEAEKKPRKKRPHAYVRKREVPTDICDHKPGSCPDCGRTLSGGNVHRVRQVIELPVVQVRVIEHRIWARWCGVCRKRVLAKPDLSSQVMGSHRMGIRVMSLVAHLHRVARMPKRQIQRLLASLWGLRISIGEVSEILHAVARAGAGVYAQLREQIRGSPCVNADETSWRENGQNGYLWSFSNPTVRYFTINKSRAHTVPEEVLGTVFKGILGSDFYAAYSYYLGQHQRCWVHFLRDLHALGEANPKNKKACAWVKRVVGLYEKARDYKSESRSARLRARFRFQEALVALGEKYAAQNVPQSTLAKRCTRFASELFTFVEYPDVPSHNNSAERAVRPAVIARKVSGGTRSKHGSETAAMLMSLFGTWSLQGHDPLEVCRAMLAGILSTKFAAP